MRMLLLITSLSWNITDYHIVFVSLKFPQGGVIRETMLTPEVQAYLKVLIPSYHLSLLRILSGSFVAPTTLQEETAKLVTCGSPCVPVMCSDDKPVAKIDTQVDAQVFQVILLESFSRSLNIFRTSIVSVKAVIEMGSLLPQGDTFFCCYDTTS